jgi:hypothetical protein|nr:MAG TPA: hypothetical protein [Caudoviricetes sp.]
MVYNYDCKNKPIGRKEIEMLYTVHTSFDACDETGKFRGWSQTEKIEANDKIAAKIIAWRRIVGSGEYSRLVLKAQNARASSRK